MTAATPSPTKTRTTESKTHGRAGADASPVVRLLRVEGEARAAKSLDELAALMVNEAVLLLRARQTFLFRPSTVGRLEVAAASGVAKVDRSAPLMQAVEQQVELQVMGKSTSNLLAVVDLWPDPASSAALSATATLYPYRHGLWMPLLGRNGAVQAGMLLLRDEAWLPNDLVLAQRLASAFGQAWHWLASEAPWSFWSTWNRRRALIAGSVGAILALFPVSMSTLAPMEIVPRAPFIVTAPIDGVIETVTVDANAQVADGDKLLTFSTTVLRNRFEVAEREVDVAAVRVKKMMLAAVSDMRARHDLAVAQADLAVKAAERDFARDMLSRATVASPRHGVALFGDKRELIGRAVSTGERIMDIADPKEVEVRVSVAASDSIVLDTGKPIKVFLDSAPLSSRTARIIATDYAARVVDGGQAAYRVTARFDDQELAPRLGMRGTAQLYGDRVALIYYLLRRPFSAARQWAGL